MRRVAESGAPVPIPPFPGLDLTNQWPLWTYLELAALASAVRCARYHARQLLWEWGLKELIEPTELVVSEIVTNAVRASGGLDSRGQAAAGGVPTIRFWLATDETSVLVLVWDGSPLQPERQEPGPEADSGRGLLLVEAYCARWGSFVPDGWPGKVVWALCQS